MIKDMFLIETYHLQLYITFKTKEIIFLASLTREEFQIQQCGGTSDSVGEAGFHQNFVW